MDERPRVTFLLSDILPVSKARSDKEELLFRSGARILEVNVTPASLRAKPEFSEHPLLLTVVELLPCQNGQIIEPDWRERLIKKQFGPAGILVNADTHLDEPTSVAYANDLRDDLARMRTRPSYNIFITGLGEAWENLSTYLSRYPAYAGLDHDHVDINRYFIDPLASPENLYEELAQAYLRFVISRYFLYKPLILDTHSEPTETQVSPHAILGRTALPYRANDLYSQATSLFSQLSIVWDLKESEYSSEKLDRSFADALLKFGFFALTVEVAAGKGGIHQHNKLITMFSTALAMLKENLLDEDLAKAYLKEIEGRLNGEVFKPTVNQLMPDKQLRRDWVKVPISHNGMFQALPHITEKHLHAGDQIGTFTSSSGIITETAIRIPDHISECVILGIPDEGIYNIGQYSYMYISLAVPDS